MNKTNDLTRGNIYENILTFAIPAIIANIFIQLHNYLDAVVVGRFIGKEALAGIGIVSPYIYILSAFVSGLTIGGGIIISRLYIKKEFSEITRCSSTIYILVSVLGVALTTLIYAFIEHIVSPLNLEPNIEAITIDYLKIYALGIVPIFGYSAITSILRGVGNTRISLVFLIGSSAANFVLNIIFVAGFDLGIKWVAAGTVISQSGAFVMLMLYIRTKLPVLWVNPLKLKYHNIYSIETLRLGLPTSLQQLSVSLGALTLIVIVASYGTDVIAAFTSAQKLLIIIMVIFSQLSLAITTIVAQSYAAEKYTRIKEILKAAITIQLIASTAILILISMFSTYFMMIFSDDINIINIGKQYLLIIGLSLWIFSIMTTFTGVLRGLGNTVVPMAMTLVALWVVKIPVAIALCETLGEVGIWFSEPISWIFGSITLIIFYYSQKSRYRL